MSQNEPVLSHRCAFLRQAPDGHPYYYHVESGRTQWHAPSLHIESATSSEAIAGDAVQSRKAPQSVEVLQALESSKGDTSRGSVEGVATRKKTRRAKTSRSPRRGPVSTRHSGAATRRDRFWNDNYRPTPLATEPLAAVEQPPEGWVGVGDYPKSRGLERRNLNPAADIQYFAGGSRARSAKEIGPPRVVQQWKEGLRADFPDPLTREEAEIEQLRKLLRRGEGVGTPSDQWGVYDGPGGPAERELRQLLR